MPFKKVNCSAHFSQLTKLLIVLHPALTSGSAFHKLTVLTVKTNLLMSNLTKKLLNFYVFPLIEFSPMANMRNYQDLYIIIYILPFKILNNIMRSVCICEYTCLYACMNIDMFTCVSLFVHTLTKMERHKNDRMDRRTFMRVPHSYFQAHTRHFPWLKWFGIRVVFPILRK